MATIDILKDKEDAFVKSGDAFVKSVGDIFDKRFGNILVPIKKRKTLNLTLLKGLSTNLSRYNYVHNWNPIYTTLRFSMD